MCWSWVSGCIQEAEQLIFRGHSLNTFEKHAPICTLGVGGSPLIVVVWDWGSLFCALSLLWRSLRLGGASGGVWESLFSSVGSCRSPLVEVLFPPLAECWPGIADSRSLLPLTFGVEGGVEYLSSSIWTNSMGTDWESAHTCPNSWSYWMDFEFF